MSKRLTKTIWYGSDVDSNGNPILPSTHGGLDGLNYGELFLHLSNGKATLWTLSSDGKIVEITGGGSEVDMSSYLLKSIWDKVFEIRTDSQGTEYIFGKLPVVTQYGITMYSGDGVDIPSLASGLPFDGRTIWYNPDTQQIEVIGGTGGGSGEGVSNFWDLSGIPSWITNSKPKYTYSEIEGTPDLTKYALVSQIPSLSGYATESWVNQQNYAIKATTLSGYGITDAYTKTNVDDLLRSYVTLGGTPQTITGEKNFVGGLKVNGSPIYYDTEKKYWKLEGDLLVTGGVTMYGNEGTFTPSTIMDAILYDDATLGINSNGQLYVKGGNSGGGLDITALQNYLTQNSYLNVTSGDNRYLKLSGGTLTGVDNVLIINRTNLNQPCIGYEYNGNSYGSLGLKGYGDPFVYNASTKVLSQIYHKENISTLKTDLGLGTNAYTSTSYLPSSSYTATDVLAKIKTVDGSASGLDADLLDGQEGSWHRQNVISFGRVNYTSSLVHDANVAIDGMLYNYGSNTYWRNTPDMTYGQILTLKSYGNNELMGQLAWDIRHGESDTTRYLWWRAIQNESTISNAKWHQIAFTDSNVESATKATYLKTQYSNSTSWHDDYLLYAKWSTDKADHLDIKIDGYYTRVDVAKKLNTARTIWGQSFDGTGDISGHMTLTTGFDAGGVNMFLVTDNAYVGSIRYSSVWKGKTHTFGTNGLTAMTILENGNVGIGTTSPSYKLDVNGDIATSQYLIVKAWTGYGSGSCDMWYDGTNTRLDMGSGLKVAYNILVGGGITMYSDQRKKTILNHVELSLKQIANAPLIEHYYNSDESKTTHVGSIAQYWANMNDWFCKLDSEGYYTMEIQNAALASAISIARELDRYETKTDKAIKKLKERIRELEEEVELLKAS